MELLADLNPEQLRAVTFGEGPLLIVAGVGTGKTTAITRRIAWLIAEKHALPSEILALTFTDKAAAEMEARVDTLVPYGYVDAQISTFHAFCDRILRENAVLLGLPTDFRILTEAEQAIFLKERLFELPLQRFRPLGNPMRHLRSLLKLISRAKDEDISPTAYAEYAERLLALATQEEEAERQESLQEEAETQQELAAVYAKYQEMLAEAGFVDFGDQIVLVLRLFRDHPQVLDQYIERFRYILVDEFQDTNHAQFELLRLLARHRNLTVCGDDDQSIYKFRGAAISNILGFQQVFDDAELIVLDRNYRSTQPILDSAYRLIQHNNPDRLEVRAGIEKQLHAAAEGGRPPQHMHFETLEDECDFVADTIRMLHEQEDRGFSDFAILVRSNARADAFLRALNLARIPWRFSGSRGLYDQDEIRFVIALLRLIADPQDTLSMHHVASSDIYGISAEALAALTSQARRQNQPLLQVIRIAVRTPTFLGLHAQDQSRLAVLVEHLDALIPLSTKERTGELLYQYLGPITGLLERWSNAPDASDALRIQNIARLFSIIERFSRVARYDRVAWFVDYLDDLIEAGDNPPVGDAQFQEDAVHVLTIHQAKGLEYPIVFLVGLISGSFPSPNRSDPIPLPDALVEDLASSSDFHRQEERRLFYVGMTRAKEDIFFTSAQDYGGKRARKPSLFVSEALDTDASLVTPQRRSPLLRITRLAEPAPDTSAVQQELLLFPIGEEILPLSYRRIDDYLTCPLRYKYAHVLQVPIRPHHSMLYGSAIHQAIRFYQTERMAGRDVTIRELHAAFRKHWRSEGFLTREHEELRLLQGLRALEAFHAYEVTEGATPSFIERRFSMQIDDVRLVGVFDRIDLDATGGKVIDYKTTEITSVEQADKRAKSSKQLALYALAFQHQFGGSLPATLELRFLTPDVLVGTTKPTEKMIEKVKQDIAKVAKGIRKNHFPGEPAFRACQHCSYASICPDRRAT